MEEQQEESKLPVPESNGSNEEQGATNLGDHAKNFALSLWEFVKDLMNIKDDTDQAKTIERITSGIDFQGFNVWILICSIFIASIGLNTDSTAVIIGAMLISPLMGPILGVGLAVGTQDFKTLVRSLKAYGITVGISLLASYVYFLISPLSEDTSELLGRVKPTFLDALVAAFGGLAGVIAVSRKEATNVIPGVAIATALMPPLCTAGYGLAIGNYSYFAGALYLFLLNSLFICMTTFIVLRYLNFPLKEQLSKSRQMQVKRYIFIFTLLIMVPATWLFVTVILESKFESDAELFVQQEIIDEHKDIKVNMETDYNDTVPRIDVVIIGKYMSQEIQDSWHRDLVKYDLEDCKLIITQSSDNPALQDNGSELMTELLIGKESIAQERDAIKEQLQTALSEIQRLRGQQLSYRKIEANLKVGLENITRFGYSNVIEGTPGGVPDTIFTFHVSYAPGVDTAGRTQKEQNLAHLLQTNFDLDSVRILHYPTP